MKNTNVVKQAFEGITLNVIPDSVHEFIMTTEEVAKGYGVSPSTIRDHKSIHADELFENKHWFSSVENSNSRSGNLQVKNTYWTKNGIVRLGFFIKSENAKRFRDWAEDLIMRRLQATERVLPNDDEFVKETESLKDFFAPFGFFKGVEFMNVRGNKK